MGYQPLIKSQFLGLPRHLSLQLANAALNLGTFARVADTQGFKLIDLGLQQI